MTAQDKKDLQTLRERPEIMRLLKAFKEVPKERKQEAYTKAMQMFTEGSR